MSTEKNVSKNFTMTETMRSWVALGHVDPETHRLVEAPPNVRVKRDGNYVWVIPAQFRQGFESDE